MCPGAVADEIDAPADLLNSGLRQREAKRRFQVDYYPLFVFDTLFPGQADQDEVVNVADVALDSEDPLDEMVQRAQIDQGV